MNIERIHIPAFGRLSGFDSGSEPLGSLVAVLGPNEAGKSTLFSFMTTALYGFQPASRDRNPHVPWGADEATGSLELRLDGGRGVTVERRLRSSPSARVTLDGDTTELRNQPLPWVEHVPRTVFRQVFAVTLADLAGLDEETWVRIQDRVLGSMGATDVRPARAVADELEREAGEIWRPNRRGNQLLRQVQSHIRELRARRGGALERDREIRDLVAERENVRLRLREAREDRQHDRLAVERIQRLLPIKRQLDRIDALRALGGPRQQLTGLPDDPTASLSALDGERARVARELDGTTRELVGPAETIAAFDTDAQRLVEHHERISRFRVRAASVESEQVRIVELRHAVEELGVRIEAASDQLLTSPWDLRIEERVTAVSTDLLRDRIERLEHLAATKPAVEPASAEAAASPDMGPLLGLGVVGGLLVSWSIVGGPTWALVPGVAGLAVAATLGVGLMRTRGEQVAPPVESGDRTALGAEVAAMLRDVPVRDEYLRPPGLPLLSGLERMQHLAAERRAKSSALASAAERVADVDAEAEELSSSLCLGPGGNGASLATWLERELPRAERARNAAESAVREQAGLERTRERLGNEAAAASRDRTKLTDAIARAASDGTSTAIAEVQSRIEAHLEADRLRTQLERAHPDLTELETHIRSTGVEDPGWAIDDEDLGRRKARMEEIEADVESLIARGEALERDAAHLRNLETADSVDSEIASLQEDEERLVAERDRKWVLAQLVRQADRRFREEHQPDLLRRASAYLRHLTGGRYDRLLVDEGAGGDLFQLVGPGIAAPIPLSRPISTGTLEQAYLSLRLAIVDHLDEGRERLPLFMDEVFVNWDTARRDRGLDALTTVSDTRQVFAFTCHPEIAAALEARGARILRLVE